MRQTQKDSLKYIKKSFHIDTLYIRIDEFDKPFYKGLAIGFNKDETKLKIVETDHWVDIQACKHLIQEISKEEFKQAFNKMTKMLKL